MQQHTGGHYQPGYGFVNLGSLHMSEWLRIDQAEVDRVASTYGLGLGNAVQFRSDWQVDYEAKSSGEKLRWELGFDLTYAGGALVKIGNQLGKR